MTGNRFEHVWFDYDHNAKGFLSDEDVITIALNTIPITQRVVQFKHCRTLSSRFDVSYVDIYVENI